MSGGRPHRFDIESEDPIALLPPEIHVDGTLALSPDEEELAFVDSEGCIQIWNLEEARLNSIVRPVLGTPRDLIYAPDGSFLLYTQACHVRFRARA